MTIPETQKTLTEKELTDVVIRLLAGTMPNAIESAAMIAEIKKSREGPNKEDSLENIIDPLDGEVDIIDSEVSPYNGGASQ